MSVCGKCWEEASRKMYIYTDKTQTELYLRIIAEHNNHIGKAQKDRELLEEIEKDYRSMDTCDLYKKLDKIKQHLNKY